MAWLVTHRMFEKLENKLLGIIDRRVTSIDREVDRELEKIGRKVNQLVEDAQAKLTLELSELKQQRQWMEAELRVCEERFRQATSELFDLGARVRIAERILEKAHQVVTYVPENPLKTLSEGDVEKMEGVTDKVRDHLREILQLQESLNAAGDPGVEGFGI